MKLVPENKIVELREKFIPVEEKLALYHDNPVMHQEILEKRKRQELFLEAFRKCCSPALACKQANVPMGTYYRWRNDDYEFAMMLNEIGQLWSDEILASAASRAVGYVQADESTTSGFTEDAAGTVVRFNGSDSLAKTFVDQRLKMTEQQEAPPKVVINMAAFGIATEKLEETNRDMAKVYKHLDFVDEEGNIVDGEYEEVPALEVDEPPPAAA